MGTLFLIRHGQASYGEADYDRLSRRGEEQARAVGRWLATARVDAVYAGPLRRQQQTIALAADTAAALGVTLPAPATLPELAEYPAFEMLQHLMPRLVAEDPRFEQLQTAPTPRLLDDAFHTVLGRWARDEWSVDGVERVGAFVGRVRAGLDAVIRAAGSGARLACVTSAGPIGVAVGLAFGLPDDRMVRTSVVIKNASITELKFRSQGREQREQGGGDPAGSAGGAGARPRGIDWQPDQLSLVTFNLVAHLPAQLDTHR